MPEAPDIRQLPVDLQNKIAAGEVIERPSAVVKELIENSLDAGAGRIAVRIEQGGKRLIEVVDDGHGIRPAQLPLALSRHATSKLSCAEDLVAIASLGFRGEALPSIAGVSELELASEAGEGGRLLRVRGGGLEEPEPCAMPRGTRVTVRNLFWNVPARLKFLKSDGAETGHVSDMLQRFALGHPRVAFSLTVNERNVLDLPAHRSMVDRIRACCGKDLAASLLTVAADRPSAQLTGFAAHPSQAKPTAKRQFVFLNGRHIHDKLLVAAVRAGYEGRLEPRLHAQVFLHIDLDPALVDVNVHPTKAEVRFRNSGEIFALVRDALQRALAEEEGGFGLLQTPIRSRAPTQDVVRREVVKAAEPAIQERFLPRGYAPLPAAGPQVSAATDAQRTAEAPVAYAGGAEPQTSSPSPAHDELPPGLHRVVQLGDMYLLLETDDGIRLVDQHALHEKAIWLSLDPDADGYAAAGVQELLVPISLELSAAEMAQLAPHLEELRRHGIAAEAFGPTTLLLRSVPARLKRMNWERFFAELAAEGDALARIDDLRTHLAHRAACHAAVKAGQRLSEAEQRELATLLYRLEGLEHCPHGRPTTLDLSWAELERRFQR